MNAEVPRSAKVMPCTRHQWSECRPRALRNTNGILLDIGTDGLSETRLRDEVNLDAEEVFEENPQLHEVGEGRLPLEADEEVHVAVSRGLLSRHGAEQAQGLNAEAVQVGPVCRENRENVGASHDADFIIHGVSTSCTSDASPDMPGLLRGTAGASPDMTDASPDMAGLSPGMAGASPDMTDASPDMAGLSPGMAGASPDMTDASPDMAGPSPGMAGASPDMTDASPDMAGLSPDMTGASPDMTDASQDMADVSPGMTGGSPDMPGDTPAVPGDAQDMAGL